MTSGSDADGTISQGSPQEENGAQEDDEFDPS